MKTVWPAGNITSNGCAFSITSSPQSQLGQTSSVTLEEIGLRARNWQLIYAAAVFGVLVWGGFVFWCFPQFARQKPAPVTQIVTPVPYQQVTTESRLGQARTIWGVLLIGLVG